MATYLVTGATGLIGRHFVRELLARPDTDRVWLLVREQSQERLDRAARDWPAAERITTVTGDVSQPGLGIADPDALRGVDNVVHLAALYDVTADDETSIAANVGGTQNVLDLAAELGAGR
jgi:thioester reductase-like protein